MFPVLIATVRRGQISRRCSLSHVKYDQDRRRLIPIQFRAVGERMWRFGAEEMSSSSTPPTGTPSPTPSRLLRRCTALGPLLHCQSPTICTTGSPNSNITYDMAANKFWKFWHRRLAPNSQCCQADCTNRLNRADSECQLREVGDDGKSTSTSDSASTCCPQCQRETSDQARRMEKKMRKLLRSMTNEKWLKCRTSEDTSYAAIMSILLRQYSTSSTTHTEEGPASGDHSEIDLQQQIELDSSSMDQKLDDEEEDEEDKKKTPTKKESGDVLSTIRCRDPYVGDEDLERWLARTRSQSQQHPGTIMDRFPEARAFLRLMGRATYSEDFRDCNMQNL